MKAPSNHINEGSKPGPEYFSLHIADKVTAMLAYWDRNLVCRYANKAYAGWFGVPSDQLIDKMTLDQLLGPELFALNRPYITRALQGKVQTFERDLTTPAGELRHALATYYPDIEKGEVKGIIVHVADTTFIRKIQDTEKNLFESREMFERFMETSPIPAWIRDENGIMRYMNEAYMRRFELEARQIGMSIQEIFSRELAGQYLNTTRQVLEAKLPVESMMRFTDGKGHVRHYKLIRFTLIYQGQTMVAGWAVDLTDLVDAHEQIMQLGEEKKREVLRSVIATQESEREFISKRIHEQTAQTLSSCKMILDSLLSSSTDSEMLKAADTQLQTAIKDLRYICDSLTPLALIDLGLEEALKENVREMVRRYSIKIRIRRFDKLTENISASEKLNIFRIVSDLLNVLVKYARASSIGMRFLYAAPALQLNVDYTGDPFADLADTREMRNVRDRIEFYNGVLQSYHSGSSGHIDIRLTSSSPPRAPRSSAPHPSRIE